MTMAWSIASCCANMYPLIKQEDLQKTVIPEKNIHLVVLFPSKALTASLGYSKPH